jgi:hypothetical protein
LEKELILSDAFVAEASVALILRRSQAFVSLGGATADDDFDVMDGTTRIGRIYFQPSSSRTWRWSLSQALGLDKKGRAETRALALEALSEAYSDITGIGPEPAPTPRRSVEFMSIVASLK